MNNVYVVKDPYGKKYFYEDFRKFVTAVSGGTGSFPCYGPAEKINFGAAYVVFADERLQLDLTAEVEAHFKNIVRSRSTAYTNDPKIFRQLKNDFMNLLIELGVD